MSVLDSVLRGVQAGKAQLAANREEDRRLRQEGALAAAIGQYRTGASNDAATTLMGAGLFGEAAQLSDAAQRQKAAQARTAIGAAYKGGGAAAARDAAFEAGEIGLGADLDAQVRALSREQRQTAAENVATVGNFAVSLLKVPEAERQARAAAFIDGPGKQLGLTQESLGQITDWSDAGLTSVARASMTASEQLALDDRAAEKAYRSQRDTVEDARYQGEQGYRASRDTVEDQRFAQQMQYQRERDARDDSFRSRQLAAAAGREYRSESQAMRRAEGEIRKEFVKGQEGFVAARDAVGQMAALARDGSGSSDIAFLYTYMKALDPGSVVREGEFATAENAGGVSERIRNLYNKARDGQRLTPRLREEFTGSARSIYEARRQQYEKDRATYQEYARDYGVDPDRAAPDLTAAGPSTPASDPLALLLAEKARRAQAVAPAPATGLAGAVIRRPAAAGPAGPRGSGPLGQVPPKKVVPSGG